MVADFNVDGNGTPSLSNIQDVTPDKAGLVEAHGFTRDNKKIIFTGDMENTHTWGMDIFTKDLSSGTITNLTKGAHWEEHASFSPSGKKIVYMSSEPSYPRGTELRIMNPDGSGKQTLTHLNTKGFKESVSDQVMATSTDWSSDGRKLALTEQFSFKYPATQMAILTFAGKCGG